MRAVYLWAIGLLLGLAGCRHEPPAPPPPPLPDPACYPPGYHFAFLETDTQIFRQGATIRVTPTANVAPAGTQALPLSCTSDWSVTGPATLSPDRTRLTIDPDAEPGATVSIGFVHAGKPVSARLTVIGRDSVVLTGRRSQQRMEGCEIPDKVGELEFYPGNRFAVTFMPFETYQDYWGTYEFDPAGGRLALKVEGGNFVPPGLDLEGRAELEAGRLVLRDMFLGSRAGYPARGSCTYYF
ncbi:MAG TPA: hypothetical protein VF759_02045 [Allosphingosinicella sp.]|jgi:hypothetical protein